MAKKEVTTNEATGVQTTELSQDPAQIAAQTDSAQTGIGGASAPAPGTSAQTEKAQTPPAQTESAAPARDYVSEIGGNFNLHNATALFGKDAMKALQAYAQFGGHGVITEAEFGSNLFGGLGAPAKTDHTRIDAINNALSNLGK